MDIMQKKHNLCCVEVVETVRTSLYSKKIYHRVLIELPKSFDTRSN